MRKQLAYGLGLMILATGLVGCRAVGEGAVIAGEEAAASGGFKVLAKELGGKAVEGMAAGATHAAAGAAAEQMLKKHESSALGESSSQTAFIGGHENVSRTWQLINEKRSNLPTPDQDDALIVEIKMAIRAADTAESLAQRSVNGAQLPNYFAGEALKEETSRIEAIRANGLTRSSECVGLQFDHFKVNSDGSKAQVHVVERWRTQPLDANGNLIGQSEEHDVPQTEFLEKVGGNWKVTAFIND